MAKVQIAVRAPLPETKEGLERRINELLEVKRAVDEEIKAILGTNVEWKREQRSCLRCGHIWVPKKALTIVPKVCAKCKSAYWNRPYAYKRREKKAPEFVPEGLLPPPPPPTSLSERLRQLRETPKTTEELPESLKESLGDA